MTIQASPFGTRLRQWRQHRGLNQLSLAGQVGSTGRHISFLETRLPAQLASTADGQPQLLPLPH